MEGMANPIVSVSFQSGKFPTPLCIIVLYIQYEPRWLLKGHRNDGNLLLVTETITDRDYAHPDIL